MIHETNLYGGWWIFTGLAGLGLGLLLASLGGAGLWFGGIVLAGLVVAAVAALQAGFAPHHRLVTELSERGVALHRPGRSRASAASEPFFPWHQISGVRILPRPGYWQVSLQTTIEPDTWHVVGQGLDLAEQIAEVAGLPYDETRKTAVNMGVKHYWG